MSRCVQTFDWYCIYCDIANMVQSKGAKLLETYPERLTALIAAKGDSNMYCEYFCISFSIHLKKKLKHVFTLSLWGVVCSWVR
jgi:hypothetical protein